MSNTKRPVFNRQFISGISLMLSISLSGCVTQEYVTNSEDSIQERSINTKEAATARLQLALEYLKKGKIPQAKLNLDRAEQLNADVKGVYSTYAFYYQKVGEIKLANKAYLEALDRFPNDENTRNNYGAFLCTHERFEEAEKQFVISINSPFNTQTANSYENAGLCALRDESWQRAKDHLTAVLRYEAVRARSILGLTKANIELGDVDAAINSLRSYQRIYSQTPQSLWLAVQIEYKRKNSALADQLGAILLQKYPQSDQTKAYIAKKFK